jgi:hypothetical protein
MGYCGRFWGEWMPHTQSFAVKNFSGNLILYFFIKTVELQHSDNGKRTLPIGQSLRGRGLVHCLWTLVKYILIPTFGRVSFRTLAKPYIAVTQFGMILSSDIRAGVDYRTAVVPALLN